MFKYPGIILEKAVGPSQKVQDFESEPLAMRVEHSHTVKATLIASGYGSKDCAFRPAPTAFSRIIILIIPWLDLSDFLKSDF
jgi:hypothetical protein